VSALIPVKTQRVLLLLMIVLIIIIMMSQAAEVKSNTGWGFCIDTCEDPEGAVPTDDIVDNNATNEVTGS
jgi:hypothetical protein